MQGYTEHITFDDIVSFFPYKENHHIIIVAQSRHKVVLIYFCMETWYAIIKSGVPHSHLIRATWMVYGFAKMSPCFDDEISDNVTFSSKNAQFQKCTIPKMYNSKNVQFQKCTISKKHKFEMVFKVFFSISFFDILFLFLAQKMFVFIEILLHFF